MSLSPLYVCCGEDPLLVIEATDQIRQEAVEAGYQERTVLIAGSPGFYWDQLIQVAATGTFFSSKRLIELRIPNGKPGVEGAKALQRYCADFPEDTILMVILPTLTWQDRKAVWFKALVEQGRLLDLKAPTREQLPQWLNDRLKRHQQSADLPTLEWFANRIEGNLLAASQEISKLAILYPPGVITLSQLQETLSNAARYTSDQLSDAFLKKEWSRYWHILETLKEEGEPLPLLLWRMSEDSRTLYKVLSAIDVNRSKETAFKEAKLFYERRTQFQRYLSTMTLSSLSSILLQYSFIDRQIKGLASGNPWATLRYLPIELGLAG